MNRKVKFEKIEKVKDRKMEERLERDEENRKIERGMMLGKYKMKGSQRNWPGLFGGH